MSVKEQVNLFVYIVSFGIGGTLGFVFFVWVLTLLGVL